MRDGFLLRTLEYPSDNRLNDVAISADGELAASTSDDKLLALWDLRAGEILCTFMCDSRATACAFIKGGQLVTADGAGRVYFLAVEA